VIFDANDFTTSQDGTTFVAEIADLQLWSPPSSFTLNNCPKEGQQRTFKFVKTDHSGGDIAGWKYEEEDGQNKGRQMLKVLIIND
jgi:hypothetical protein